MGKLIYLACKIRPNIIYVISQLSKHNTNLQKNYLQVIKIIVRYLEKII